MNYDTAGACVMGDKERGLVPVEVRMGNLLRDAGVEHKAAARRAWKEIDRRAGTEERKTIPCFLVPAWAARALEVTEGQPDDERVALLRECVESQEVREAILTDVELRNQSEVWRRLVQMGLAPPGS